jgi:transcription elongation factor Elf1
MEIKKCPKCNKEKELSEFNKNKDRSSSWCKICIRERSQLYYQNNTDKVKAKVKAIQKSRRDWFNDLKKDLKCVKCGEDHISCLDFHHLDPSKKDLGIAESVTRNLVNFDLILKEIEKCIVVCKNCHAKIHYEEKNMLP